MLAKFVVQRSKNLQKTWSKDSGVARLSAARDRPLKCRPFQPSNLLTRILMKKIMFRAYLKI